MDKIKDALIAAQVWVMEACGWLYMGWHLTADFLSAHKHWNLLAIIALGMIAVKF
jgi:hypothetical protein